MLHLDGDDELIYVDSYAQLKNECTDLIWCAEDRLIDSEGHVYLLSASGSDLVLNHQDMQISVQDASKLIQAHEFSRAEVCLTKIQFESVSTAIKALK
jgi:hypothetical protein